jgi:hypothetical protein
VVGEQHGTTGRSRSGVWGHRLLGTLDFSLDRAHCPNTDPPHGIGTPTRCLSFAIPLGTNPAGWLDSQPAAGGRIAAVAEQALEDDARMRLDGSGWSATTRRGNS